jgi:hypothetical protein
MKKEEGRRKKKKVGFKMDRFQLKTGYAACVGV